MVPGSLEAPEIVFPVEVDVELVLPVVITPRGETECQFHAAQSHRVVHIETIAYHRSHFVPGFGVGETADNGVGAGKSHLLEDIVGRDVVIYIAEVFPG